MNIRDIILQVSQWKSRDWQIKGTWDFKTVDLRGFVYIRVWHKACSSCILLCSKVMDTCLLNGVPVEQVEGGRRGGGRGQGGIRNCLRYELWIQFEFLLMCWPASFPVISQSGEWPDESGSSRDCCWREEYFILGRGSITTLTDIWSDGATHAVADLYRKSGSDGQGHVPLLQTHLAPDPTWIIFPVKSINIACNRWHSPIPRHRVWHGAPLTRTLSCKLPFLFWKQWSHQKPSETPASSPTMAPINPPSGPMLSLQPRRSCSVFPEPDHCL